MTRLTIDVLNPKDEALLLAILETFKKQKIIRLAKKEVLEIENDSLSMPGSPLTEAELNQAIETAEKEPSLSYEEVKHHFKA